MKFVRPRLGRPSPAMVVAMVALVLALGGTASAGSSVLGALINGKDIKKNTVTGKQVKESTLKKVKKAKQADRAKQLSPLPSGQLMSGTFAAGGAKDSASDFLATSISYPRPLSTPIADLNIIDNQSGTSPHCPGIGKADKGYLCLYNRVFYGVNTGYGYSHYKFLKVKANWIGALLYWQVNTNGPYVGGSWTLRAP